MTTSLAAQLQKLAVPQTSLLQRDKHRPSLLFDPKEAASIDRETFFEIGLSGLRELSILNPDFVVFENTLFSNTSKQIERSVQDKITNEKLDRTIRKFLMNLSPYFLLKPAHKALEWLIHRFAIQEYNRDDFLKLIFPYHETNIFVRALTLFNFQDESSNWIWLKKVQKSGIQLNKLTLFNHAASDISFLKFIGNMVIKAVCLTESKAYTLTTLFSFYCTTTIGALEQVDEVTEPQLTAILPPLLKGLSSNTPDYTASAYIITAQLLKKTKLSHTFLHRIVQRITEPSQKNLRLEATLLLIVLYQSQRDNFTKINSGGIENLVKGVKWFPPNLNKLAGNGCQVLPLILPVLESALKKIENPEYRIFVESIFNEVRLHDEATEKMIR